MTTKYSMTCFSDFHAHLWAEFSQPIENEYVNTRFLEQVEVLRSVFSRAREKGNAIIFAGDLFHKRVAVNTAVFNAIFGVFMDNSDIPVLMVRGNHDSMNNSLYSNHSLVPFQALPNVTVASTPTVLDFAGAKVACLPYGDEIEVMKTFLASPEAQESDILVAHIGVEGAKESSGHSLEGAFTLADLHSTSYTHVILGHYHKHQMLNGNTIYVGSTLPTNFSDSDEKGIVHINNEGQRKFEQLQSKKFLTLSASDLQQEGIDDIVKNNYIRLRASNDESNMIKAFMDDVPSSMRVDIQENYDTESRLGIKVDDEPTRIVEEYFNKYFAETTTEKTKSTVMSFIARAQKGE